MPIAPPQGLELRQRSITVSASSKVLTSIRAGSPPGLEFSSMPRGMTKMVPYDAQDAAAEEDAPEAALEGSLEDMVRSRRGDRTAQVAEQRRSASAT